MFLIEEAMFTTLVKYKIYWVSIVDGDVLAI